MKYNEWLTLANRAVNTAVAECFNHKKIGGWNENHITTQVLEALGQTGLDIRWDDCSQSVKWEAYKLAGTLEYQFGDIALLVRVRLTEDRHIDGVAFYEAKKNYIAKSGESEGFKSIDASQLSRIVDTTHASQVVLYDVDPMEHQVSVTSVPTAFVTALVEAKVVQRCGRLIHRYGNPWIKVIGNNLRGFELDFRTEAVEGVRAAAESDDAPFVLLNVGVGLDKLHEPQLDTFCASLPGYERWIYADEEPTPQPRSGGGSGPKLG